jgi:hypothetical protein
VLSSVTTIPKCWRMASTNYLTTYLVAAVSQQNSLPVA